MLKIATVGTGWIVQSFIDGLRYAPGLELYAVCSRSLERARALAGKNAAQAAFDSLDELAMSRADCVYIASPNALHYEQSRLMLEAGKHVLCEKPLTASLSQAQELTELARERGLVYIEAIMYMHCPAREQLRRALGEIGEVRSAHFDFSQLSSKYPDYKRGALPNIFNPKMAAGSFMDLGIYCIYPAVDLFGEPDSICALSSFLASGADAATAALLDCGGVLVSLTSCKTGQDYAGSQIVGDMGTIRIESISKLTGIELLLNSGERRLICGDTPKEQLMGNEARAFFEFIDSPQRTSDRYAQAAQTALLVSRVMSGVRECAGIKF